MVNPIARELFTNEETRQRFSDAVIKRYPDSNVPLLGLREDLFSELLPVAKYFGPQATQFFDVAGLDQALAEAAVLIRVNSLLFRQIVAAASPRSPAQVSESAGGIGSSPWATNHRSLSQTTFPIPHASTSTS